MLVVDDNSSYRGKPFIAAGLEREEDEATTTDRLPKSALSSWPLLRSASIICSGVYFVVPTGRPPRFLCPRKAPSQLEQRPLEEDGMRAHRARTPVRRRTRLLERPRLHGMHSRLGRQLRSPRVLPEDESHVQGDGGRPPEPPARCILSLDIMGRYYEEGLSTMGGVEASQKGNIVQCRYLSR